MHPTRRRCVDAVVTALAGLGCGDAATPATRTCSEILALRIPEAEVVEAWPGPGGVALTYRVEHDLHRLECVLTEPAPGRLRAQSLRFDDRELSEGEVLLVNSDLLLAEIRRADPGPPGEPGWTARIERLLSRL